MRNSGRGGIRKEDADGEGGERVDVDVLSGDGVRAEGGGSGGGGVVGAGGEAEKGGGGGVEEGMEAALEEELEEDAVELDGNARHI